MPTDNTPADVIIREFLNQRIFVPRSQKYLDWLRVNAEVFDKAGQFDVNGVFYASPKSQSTFPVLRMLNAGFKVEVDLDAHSLITCKTCGNFAYYSAGRNDWYHLFLQVPEHPVMPDVRNLIGIWRVTRPELFTAATESSLVDLFGVAQFGLPNKVQPVTPIMPKVLITVYGGVVQSVISNSPCQVLVKDFDNIKDVDEEVDLDFYLPDEVQTDTEKFQACVTEDIPVDRLPSHLQPTAKAEG